MGASVDPNLDLSKRLPSVVTNLRVLNLGAGMCASPISGQIPLFEFESIVNVEIWPSAFAKLQSIKFKARLVENVIDDAYIYLLRTPANEFDVVLLIDVLEHFADIRALEVLTMCRRVGRRVVIFIPIGQCDQDEYDGNPYQRHMSTWHIGDFVGASIELLPQLHRHFSPPVDAAWVIYEH